MNIADSVGDQSGSISESTKASSTADIVTMAAASVKDAAGAVRCVAENLLRAISPNLSDGVKDQETRNKPTLDLQNIKEFMVT